MTRGLFPVFCLVLLLAPPVFADDTDFPFRGPLPGDGRAAEQYLLWAETALAAGRRAEALSALERGADFASDSSDISFLLARVRFDDGRPAGAVLEALRRALEADRWNRYTPEAARLLEGEVLIRLRLYREALETLSGLPRSAVEMRLRLSASRFLPDRAEFFRLMGEALDRYPREAWPLRIFFEDAAGRLPSEAEGGLMALALRRLPLLLEAEADLAWLAFPFIADLEEAWRLTAAYRAAGGRNPAALPALLSLGLVTEEEAVAELFGSGGGGEPGLDRTLLQRAGELLLTDAGQRLFRRNLLSFSGVITEDADGDGYPEALARCREGLITLYTYDGDQDGLPELSVFFGEGIPFRAELAILPGTSAPQGAAPFAYPVRDGDRPKAHIRWEQYPAVLESAMGELRYLPRPGDFFYAPFRLLDLGGTGFLFPETDPRRIRLSGQTLFSFAALVERPGREFAGSVEQIELNRGIPERAREYLDGRMVSETIFSRGRPVLQRIDLDLDGRMETVRHFRRSGGGEPISDIFPDYSRDIEYSESDWDGDGIFESVERFTVTPLPGTEH